MHKLDEQIAVIHLNFIFLKYCLDWTNVRFSNTVLQLPVVIKVPRMQYFSIPTCDVQFSILGLGDIVVPGMCLSFFNI